jgi:hypothetical protein
VQLIKNKSLLWIIHYFHTQIQRLL